MPQAAVAGGFWATVGQAAVAAVVAAAVSYVLNKAIAHFNRSDRGLSEEFGTTPRLGNRYSSAESRKIVYGRVRVGGPIVLSATAFNDNLEELHENVVFAGHQVDSFPTFYIDGTPVDATELNPDGTLSTGEYAGILKINAYTGEPGQVADPTLVADTVVFGAYTSAMVGNAIAYVHFTYVYDKAFKGSPPNRAEAVVHGKRCYDPRLDSTEGGSGTHRKDDAATWAFTTNPALFVLDYLTDVTLGQRIDYSKIDIPSFAAAANVCDESIQLTGGGSTARYRAAAWLDTGDIYHTNVKKLLDLFDGELFIIREKVKLYAGGPAVASGTIDETYLRQGQVVLRSNSDTSERFNEVHGRYWDETRAFQETECQPRKSAAYIADDGQILTTELNLGGITSEARAQYLCQIHLEKYRADQGLFLNCNLKAFQFEPWQVVNVSIDRLGLSNVPFRIVDWRVEDNFAGVTLDLKKYDATVWDWSPTDYITPAGQEAIELPEGAMFAGPTSLVAASVVGGVQLVWTNPDPDVFADTLVYASDTDDYSTADEVAILRAGQVQIAQAEDSEVYYWVRARNRFGDMDQFDEMTAGVLGTGGPATGAGAAVTVAPTAPEDPNTGDLWFDSDDGNHPYQWDGDSWESIRDTTIADAQSTADSKNTIYFQPTEPLGTNTAGDLWIDTDDGNRRYEWNGSAWVDAQDSDITQAIADAAAAQSTADTKAEVFRQASEPIGTAGDIWFDTDDGNKPYVHNGTVWVSVQDAAIAEAYAEATAAGALADGKITTYWQNSEPTGPDLRDGDLWFDTDDGNKCYRYNNPVWSDVQDDAIAQAIADAADAQATADGKVETFFQSTPPSFGVSHTGDLWFDTDDNFKIYRFSGSVWVNARDAGIQAAIDAAAAAQGTADTKITTYYQSSAPTGGDLVDGDLWIDSNDDNKVYRRQSGVWVPVRDAGIDQAILASATAQGTADQKIRTYFQASAPSSGLTVGDIWIDTDDENRPYRWNGSVWTDFRDATISPPLPTLVGCKNNYSGFTTPNNGELYIHGFSAGVPADVDGQIYFNGAFKTVPKGPLGTSQAQTSGFIVFATSGVSFFSTEFGSKPYAFCWKRGAQWYYDNGSSATAFTPSSDMVRIGQARTGFTADNLTFSSIYSAPQSMDVVGADQGGRMPDQRSLLTVSAGNVNSVQSWTPTGSNLITSSDNGSSARIDIKAHSLYLGSGLVVGYNAGSITGLSFGTEYHIYSDDADFEGGSVTYLATLSPFKITQESDRYYVGTIITAADGGTATGGGNGGGCVALDSYQPHTSKTFEDLVAGDALPCLEETVEHCPVRIVTNPVKRKCVRIIAGKTSVVCSWDTPVTLRDGTWLRAQVVAGRRVAVIDGDEVAWEPATVEAVGMRLVLPIELGGRSFAASEHPDSPGIATHNGVKGPPDILPA